MFKLLTFILQAMMMKKSLTKTSSALEFAEKTAEKVRGYFLFAVGCLTAAVFMLVALIVAVIGMGLQLEQHGNISFTGLMISATVFFAISVFVFLISAILLSVQKQKMAERLRQKEQMADSSSLKPLMEEILKQILVNLSTSKQRPSSSDSEFDDSKK